jgi:archaeosine-15-forming tRNA-guanine transglycosylase
VSGVQRADELIVVHHDDTVSRFTDVRYTLGRAGLRVITADGAETIFPGHDVLTTHVLLAHRLTRPGRDEVVLAA